MPTAPPLPPPHLQDTRDGRMHCRMPAPPPTHTHTRVYKVHLRDARQHRCRTPAYHAPSPLPTRPLPPTCIMRDSTNAGCPRTTSSPKLTMYFGSMPHVAPKRVAYGCTCIHGDGTWEGGGGGKRHDEGRSVQLNLLGDIGETGWGCRRHTQVNKHSSTHLPSSPTCRGGAGARRSEVPPPHMTPT